MANRQRNQGAGMTNEDRRLINDKKIGKETYIRYPGLPAWKTAENIPEILRLAALTPPAIGA